MDFFFSIGELMDWFLYDGEFRHEKAKIFKRIQVISLSSSQQTSAFRCQNMTCITKNFVQNLMYLIMASKSNWKWEVASKLQTPNSAKKRTDFTF